MSKLASFAIGALFALAMTGSALAQQRDLEVTMRPLPGDASAAAATHEIKLPDDAAPEAHDNARFGLDTANRARALKDDLNKDFGREVSEAARERARQRMPSVPAPNPGRP